MRFLLSIIFLGFTSLVSMAHTVDFVGLEFEAVEDSWVLGGAMDVSYIMPETRNIEDADLISRYAVMRMPRAEQLRIRDEIKAVMARCVTLKCGDEILDYDFLFPEFEKEPLVLEEDPEDMAFVVMKMVLPKRPLTHDLTVHWEDETGASLVISQEVEDLWMVRDIEPGESLALLEKSSELIDQRADEMNSTEPASRPKAGMKTWLMGGLVVLMLGSAAGLTLMKRPR